MAKFKITPTTTVAELKEQFRNEVGCVLRVYQGRSEASDEATLVSLGAKEGELECRTSRTVGKFEEAFHNDLNLKVKVYTKDNWVKVLDGITLAVAGQLPNGMTKAKMEEYLSYKRNEADSAEVEIEQISDEYKNILLIDIDFTRVEILKDEDSYEEVADKMTKEFGNNENGIAVLYHGIPNSDQAAIVISEDDRSYESLMEDANELSSRFPKEEESRLYLSSHIDFYNGGEEEDLYSCDGIIGVALNEFCDGGNKHEYSYDWREGYKNGKAILRVNFGNGSSIFIAYDNGGIDMLDLSDEQFDFLTRLSTLGFPDNANSNDGGAIFEYKRKDKVGFINSQAKIVIEPQFSYVRELSGSTYCFAVEKEGLWGVIKKDGSYIFDLQYEFIPNSYPIFQFKKNGKWGFADARKGEIIITPQFDDVRTDRCDDGEWFYEVMLDGKWGIMNSNFKFIVPPTFLNLGTFKGGCYASAQSADNELYGMINIHGEFVLKPQYHKITNYYVQDGELVIFAKTVDNEKIKMDINGNIIP